MRSLMFTFTAGWLVCGLTANCRCEEYSVLMRLTAELRWWRRLGVSAGTLCNVLSNLALSYAVLLQLECLQLLQSVIDLGWCRPIVACCPRYMCGRVSRKLSLWYFWKCTYLERLWRIRGAGWRPPAPLGHIWDAMLVWRKGNIDKIVSVLCTSLPNFTSSSYRLVDCVGLWSCLVWLSVFRAPLLSS